jgi:translation initiation factor IF-3
MRRFYSIKTVSIINELITHQSFTLISNNGINLGIFNIQNALKSFDRAKFNLTQVSANPPTCKLIPILELKQIIFNKDKEKKQKANVLVTKEVNMI